LQQQLVKSPLKDNQETVIKAIQQTLDEFMIEKNSDQIVEKSITNKDEGDIKLSASLTSQNATENSVVTSTALSALAFQWLFTTGLFNELQLTQGNLFTYDKRGIKIKSVAPCSYIVLCDQVPRERCFCYDPSTPFKPNSSTTYIPGFVETLNKEIIFYNLKDDQVYA
jgi:hypothetical protein